MAGQPVRKARREMYMIRAGAEPQTVLAPPHVPKPARGPRRGPKAVPVDAPPPRTPATAAANAARAAEASEFLSILGALDASILGLESSQQFKELGSKAFAFANQIMDLPLDPTDRNFGKLISVKQAIATAVFTAMARVRPGDLRDKDDDGVGALLDELKRESGDFAAKARPLTAEEMLG